MDIITIKNRNTVVHDLVTWRGMEGRMEFIQFNSKYKKQRLCTASVKSK